MKASTSLFLSTFVLGGLLASAPAHAERVVITSAEASSTYPADDMGSYDAKKIFDGKSRTSWVEGADGNGLGSSITLTLSRESDVARITFWAGMWYTANYWEYATRPTEVMLTFSDGSTEMVSIPNVMQPHVHTLKSPKKTGTVQITLKNVKSGTTFNDTGISEVLIEDTKPADMPRVGSAKASSTAAADADGTYPVENLFDGLNDTMWCEGKKGGDGTGETVEYTFETKQTLKTLHVNNGIGTSLKYFMAGNRAHNVTLTFDDGSTQKVELAGTMLQKKYPLTPVSTKSVKIFFDDVVKGKDIDDLCMSELYFEL